MCTTYTHTRTYTYTQNCLKHPHHAAVTMESLREGSLKKLIQDEKIFHSDFKVFANWVSQKNESAERFQLKTKSQSTFKAAVCSIFYFFKNVLHVVDNL